MQTQETAPLPKRGTPSPQEMRRNPLSRGRTTDIPRLGLEEREKVSIFKILNFGLLQKNPEIQTQLN